MRKLIAVLVALSLGGIAAAQAQTELKFGHVGNPGSLFEASANEFAKRANAKFEEQGLDYKVVVFGSSQLGTDEELMQKLRIGTVDFALPSTVMSSTVDAFGVFEMPYLVKDREHMKRIEEAIFWPRLAPLAEAQGYKILAVWENGFRHITNNVRPIETPEDLQGIKLRVPSGKWRVKMFQAYDANPTPMPFSEVFTALQTGVIDGQENPFAQIWSAKFQEVQKYLSLTGHVYTPAYVTAGKQKFESLPPEVQQILGETAKENQAFVYETAAALEDDLLTKLKEGGIQVNEADKEAFIAASQPIYDEFSSEVENGKELIDKALSLGSAS
jgi:tripartite ATP-independent transporter DctP family solute receptor